MSNFKRINIVWLPYVGSITKIMLHAKFILEWELLNSTCSIIGNNSLTLIHFRDNHDVEQYTCKFNQKVFKAKDVMFIMVLIMTTHPW